MTPAEAAEEMRRLSKLADNGVTALRDAAQAWADAEHAYRLAKARAWVESADLTTPAGKPETAGAREAWVNGETAAARLARDTADAMQRTALEALRTRRQQLSALQSWLAAARSELELAGFGPEVGP